MTTHSVKHYLSPLSLYPQYITCTADCQAATTCPSVSLLGRIPHYPLIYCVLPCFHAWTQQAIGQRTLHTSGTASSCSFHWFPIPVCSSCLHAALGPQLQLRQGQLYDTTYHRYYHCQQKHILNSTIVCTCVAVRALKEMYEDG